MGFLDKAKKLAEQAQTKLDEVQKQVNTSGSSGTGARAARSSSTTSTAARSRSSSPRPPPHGDPLTGAPRRARVARSDA